MGVFFVNSGRRLLTLARANAQKHYPRKGAVHYSWWQTWKANGEELLSGKCHSVGKKKCLRFWLPASFSSVAQTSPSIVSLFIKAIQRNVKEDNLLSSLSTTTHTTQNSELQEPVYYFSSALSTPVPLLCINSSFVLRGNILFTFCLSSEGLHPVKNILLLIFSSSSSNSLV